MNCERWFWVNPSIFEECLFCKLLHKWRDDNDKGDDNDESDGHDDEVDELFDYSFPIPTTRYEIHIPLSCLRKGLMVGNAGIRPNALCWHYNCSLYSSCSDIVSLDQQLLETMVLSLQRQVTELQQHLINTQGGRYMLTVKICCYIAASSAANLEMYVVM